MAAANTKTDPPRAARPDLPCPRTSMRIPRPHGAITSPRIPRSRGAVAPAQISRPCSADAITRNPRPHSAESLVLAAPTRISRPRDAGAFARIPPSLRQRCDRHHRPKRRRNSLRGGPSTRPKLRRKSLRSRPKTPNRRDVPSSHTAPQPSNRRGGAAASFAGSVAAADTQAEKILLPQALLPWPVARIWCYVPAKPRGRQPPPVAHRPGMGEGCPHARTLRHQRMPAWKSSGRNSNAAGRGGVRHHGVLAMNHRGGGEVLTM